MGKAGKGGALELRPEFQSLAGLVQKVPTECQSRWSCWLLSKQLGKGASPGQGSGPGESQSWESHSGAPIMSAKHLLYARANASSLVFVSGWRWQHINWVFYIRKPKHSIGVSPTLPRLPTHSSSQGLRRHAVSSSSWNPHTCPCLGSSMIRERGQLVNQGTQQWSGPHGTSEARVSPLPSWPLTSWTSLENRDKLPHTTAILPLTSGRYQNKAPQWTSASEFKRGHSGDGKGSWGLPGGWRAAWSFRTTEGAGLVWGLSPDWG